MEPNKGGDFGYSSAHYGSTQPHTIAMPPLTSTAFTSTTSSIRYLSKGAKPKQIMSSQPTLQMGDHGFVLAYSPMAPVMASQMQPYPMMNPGWPKHTDHTISSQTCHPINMDINKGMPCLHSIVVCQLHKEVLPKVPNLCGLRDDLTCREQGNMV